jgi:hypothetical protein
MIVVCVGRTSVQNAVPATRDAKNKNRARDVITGALSKCRNQKKGGNSPKYKNSIRSDIHFLDIIIGVQRVVTVEAEIIYGYRFWGGAGRLPQPPGGRV